MKSNSIYMTITIVVTMGLLSTATMGLIQQANAAVQRHDDSFCHNNYINNKGEFTPKENSNGGCHRTGMDGTSSGHAEQLSGFDCVIRGEITVDSHLVNTPSGNENYYCHNKH